METTRLVCLTPCRNEGWIIGNHLQAASAWADAIVLCDQMSDDDTRSIAETYAPKAILINNHDEGYDEERRSRVLFQAARSLFPGEKKVLLAIDSDELLSANWCESPEWEQIKNLPPGSGIYAKWVNICPDFRTWFPLGGHFIIGIVDDGKFRYSQGKYHIPRLVQDPSKPKYFLEDIKLLHFQYVDPARVESKRRSYHVQEWIENKSSPILLFRRLNPLLQIKPKAIKCIDTRWTDGFAYQGVNWSTIRVDGVYRWDRSVLEAFLDKGLSFFSKLDIWDADWAALGAAHGLERESTHIRDPRNFLERIVHQFLRLTQPHSRHFAVRLVHLILRPFGW